jgi:ubiquitin C-terminal hydrolase
MNKNIGIINFSNNCYLNVIIQLFLCNLKTSNIIVNYLDFENKLINPKKLLKKLNYKINISIQNDTQEALIQILDIIPELSKYFENKIENCFKCLECDKERKKIDYFSTFNIHFNSLEESIKDYIKSEKFHLECDNCKKKTETIKSSKIINLGEILIFYNILKQKIKISQDIIFNGKKYKLHGFIKHFGNQNSGHYIFIDYQNSLIIDDTNIFKMNKLDLSNIYLLFYTIIN